MRADLLCRTYQHVGFPARRIVEIATVNAGTALRLPIGRLQAGHSADVLVVDGDPRADLQALRRIRLVITAGLIAAGRTSPDPGGIASPAIPPP